MRDGARYDAPPMTLRTPLLVAAALVGLASCATSRNAALATQLDDYSIPKPLPEVWPDALHFLYDRGFELVGKDRLVLGQAEQGAVAKFFSYGQETQRLANGEWRAETAANDRRQRYRVVGRRVGERGCRIRFYSVTTPDPAASLDMSKEGNEYRDVELEIEFIERYDAKSADRMLKAAQGGK